ncbi:acylglycerol kinase, mitochondrial-like [Dendronephthya gigantea]|uniref:acylglycerol kinase, mitochondrial-like n=1 Tax=Dendronephthya gigantea TaxID=151771 RepID=UPI00106AE485|nr:acylglycerol kinase, mitochondrial-like [Dendronephthya gigantea]
MSRNIKPWFYTIRKHPKKCIFATAVGLWGVNFAVKQFRDYLQRREFCFKGKKYGDEKILAIKRPRRLLLFLNPEANDGKALKSYERDAAPILHLGGVEITTIKTDYEGQCKALTQYLDPSIDGIVIAGGDGTFLEVLTGLLRRKDQNEISKIPIGIIPLGHDNRSYRSIINDSSDGNVVKIAKSALNILDNKTKNVSVMEITTTEGKPTYAVSHIEWGPLQDAKENKRFWWTGPLKRRLPYLLATLKKWPPSVSAQLSYISTTQDHDTTSKFDGEAPELLHATTSNHSIELRETVEEKTLEKSSQVSLVGFFVNLFQDTKETFLQTSMFSSDLNKLDFIKCGWRREREGILSNQEMKTTETTEFYLRPMNDQTSWYTIDGEKFEARPIHVKILPNKIRVFCPST